MNDYRVFLNDGSTEDQKGVTGIELEPDGDGGKTLIFLFENHGITYSYPLEMVYAFSVLVKS